MPLHIIYGPDSFTRKELFAQLRESLDADGGLATNTAWFEARAATPQEIIAACDTLPFLGAHRLVVVEGLLTATRKRRKKEPALEEDEQPAAADPGEWRALVDHIEAMPPTTTLVLLDTDAPATGLLRFLGPKAKVQKCVAPAEKELPRWVMERARTIRLKLEARAAQLLAELIGQDLWALAGELEKLKTYAAGEVVREADVRELVSRAREHKNYELSDAVVTGRGAHAARVLRELLEDGIAPQPLLATVAGAYRKIAVAKDLLERGEDSAAIGAACNTQGYGIAKLIDQAQHFSYDRLRSAYARLIEADRDVKVWSMDENLALELAVQDLARQTAGPVARP